jgi:ABC-type transporter Mla maintaining outer membrane lipid asymmetry ATPase subunit MlaF
MPIVTLKEIHMSFGSQVIFDRLDLKIYPAEKVGQGGIFSNDYRFVS